MILFFSGLNAIHVGVLRWEYFCNNPYYNPYYQFLYECIPLKFKNSEYPATSFKVKVSLDASASHTIATTERHTNMIVITIHQRKCYTKYEKLLKTILYRCSQKTFVETYSSSKCRNTKPQGNGAY